MACGDMGKKYSIHSTNVTSCPVELSPKAAATFYTFGQIAIQRPGKRKFIITEKFFPFAKNEFTATTHATLCVYCYWTLFTIMCDLPS